MTVGLGGDFSSILWRLPLDSLAVAIHQVVNVHDVKTLNSDAFLSSECVCNQGICDFQMQGDDSEKVAIRSFGVWRGEDGIVWTI